jgi:Domain of unknown function (DUF6438)
MNQSCRPMTVPLIAALAVVFAVACSKSETGVAQGQIDDPVIVLSEGPCLGTCPVYDMTLHPDGAYILNGRKFVKTEGATEGNLGTGAWTAAEDVLNTADFWTMKQVQTGETLVNCMTDAPSVMITWRTPEGREKTVTYNAGCGVAQMQTLIRDLRNAMSFDSLVWTNEKFDPSTGARQR